MPILEVSSSLEKYTTSDDGGDSESLLPITVEEGSEVTIRCLDRQNLETTQLYLRRVFENEDEGDYKGLSKEAINIKASYRDHERSVYQCLAWNEIGSMQSQKILLAVNCK